MFAEIGDPASLADIGLDHDKGFAMLGSPAGALFVIPAGNRDSTGGEPDAIRGVTCKPVSGGYACATSDALFAGVGEGHLRGKPAAAHNKKWPK